MKLIPTNPSDKSSVVKRSFCFIVIDPVTKDQFGTRTQSLSRAIKTWDKIKALQPNNEFVGVFLVDRRNAKVTLS